MTVGFSWMSLFIYVNTVFNREQQRVGSRREREKERERQSKHRSELRLQKEKGGGWRGRSRNLKAESSLNHYYSTQYCLAAPSFVTHTHIQLLKSHTILHIFQQSLTLDSPSNHSISFLSSVHFKAAFKPSRVEWRDPLTLCYPRSRWCVLIHLVIVLSSWWLSMLGLATVGTTQWHWVRV